MRRCYVPGCTNMAVAGRARCATHGPGTPSVPDAYGAAHRERRRQRMREDPRCAIDGRPGTARDPLELDHIVPLIKGGTDDPANLRLIHRSENRRKGGR